MAQPTSRFRVLSGILAVGQLGISLIVPILLFTGLGVYLTDRFALGAWLTVLCVIVGVITAGCTFYRTAREFLARQRAEDKPRETSAGHASTGADGVPEVRSPRKGGVPEAKIPGADATPKMTNRDTRAVSDVRHQGGDNT